MSDERQPAQDPQEAERRLARAFADDLSAAEAEAPSFEEVAAYAEGRLTGDARLLFEERMAGDPLLRAEVDDLRQLRREMDAGRRPAVPESTRGAVPEWTRWAAAAVAAASVGAWLWLRAPSGPEATRTAGAQGATRAPAGRSPGVAPAPAAVARVQDASGPVVLLADGTLQGLGATASSAAEALRSGTLRVPTLRNDLAVSRVTAMGPEAPTAAFGPAAPLSTLTLDDRPILRWSRHPQARTYVVSVYDLELEPVAVSPRVTGTEWTPSRALPRVDAVPRAAARPHVPLADRSRHGGGPRDRTGAARGRGALPRGRGRRRARDARPAGRCGRLAPGRRCRAGRSRLPGRRRARARPPGRAQPGLGSGRATPRLARPRAPTLGAAPA
jgi:hypothetical protein